MDNLDEVVMPDAGPNVAVPGEPGDNAPDSDDNMEEEDDPAQAELKLALLWVGFMEALASWRARYTQGIRFLH